MRLLSSLSLLTLAALVIGQPNFPTADCVAPSQTNSCIGAAEIALNTCVQNCGGPQGTEVCLEGCECVAYEQYFNCVLSGCWNKVYSCEYQSLFVTAGTLCPALNVVSIPFFSQTLTNPGACSCEITTLYAAFVEGPSFELKCQDANFAQIDACLCCQQSLVVSAYYDACNTTSPSVIAAAGGTIPFSGFDTCLPTLNSVDCSSLDGVNIPVADWVESALPTGTGTFSNQPGSVTSPPYGSETVWLYSIGESAFTNTATAAAYPGNAGSVGSSESAAGSAGAATGTNTGSAASGNPNATGSTKSLAARTGIIANYLWCTFLFVHLLLALGE